MIDVARATKINEANWPENTESRKRLTWEKFINQWETENHLNI